jgi:hypothetical protein
MRKRAVSVLLASKLNTNEAKKVALNQFYASSNP